VGDAATFGERAAAMFRLLEEWEGAFRVFLHRTGRGDRLALPEAFRRLWLRYWANELFRRRDDQFREPADLRALAAAILRLVDKPHRWADHLDESPRWVRVVVFDQPIPPRAREHTGSLPHAFDALAAFGATSEVALAEPRRGRMGLTDFLRRVNEDLPRRRLTRPLRGWLSRVTTAPNELVGAVHHRQPVILRPEQHAAWLDPDTSQDELRAMLAAYPAGEMVGWEVNRQFVCDPKRDGPECLEPAA
jgi:hypothetical protein